MLCATVLLARESPAEELFREESPACRCLPEARLPVQPTRVEFSFGSAELFTRQSVTDPGGIVRQRVIPITALTVFGEYLLHPRVSVIAQFLLPLEPESTLVDGELSVTYVPPALSGGLRGTVVGLYVMTETVLEAQLFLLGGSTFADLSNDAFYPTLGWRAHLRDEGGFTMYIGTSFAFRQNTTALIYGVGHRF